MAIQDDSFIDYYHRELTYLREAGSLFAKRYPKIAQGLDFNQSESSDPHLERLLESFAFLTARLSKELDDRFPQIAAALLETLHPELIHPLPAMSIAQFKVDPSKIKLDKDHTIPAQTPLFAYTQEEETSAANDLACRFRTVYPVTLWPIEVVEASFIETQSYVFPTPSKAPWHLRLRLRNTLSKPFYELDIQDLTFYIHADRVTSLAAYEGLFAQENPCVYLAGSNHKAYPLSSLEAIGLKPEESAFPYPSHVSGAYRLLQEYFHCLEKFLFFQVKGLKKGLNALAEETSTVDLLFPIQDHRLIKRLTPSPSLFPLGCTPIINLFPKVTDPIRLTHRKARYLLLADQHRDSTTEIHSIQQVQSISDHGQEPESIVPYFSFAEAAQSSPSRWMAQREPSYKKGKQGTDLYLSFVDPSFNPSLPPHQTVYAHTLCTNRFLADHIPMGAALYMEERAPLMGIVCLRKPVSQVYSPQDGETLWKLVSQLSINHLSLTSGEASLKTFKEALYLFSNHHNKHAEKDIEALKALKTYQVTRRLGDEAWRGFVRGIGVTLVFEEHLHSGNSPFLLATILRDFLSLQVSLNSFVEVSLQKDTLEEKWMQWPPLNGQQPLL